MTTAEFRLLTRRIFRRALDRQLQRLDAPAPPDPQIGLFVDDQGGDPETQGLRIVQLMPGNREDDVADLNAGRIGGTAGIDVVDQDTGRPLHPQRRCDFGIDPLPPGAQPRPHQTPLPLGEAGQDRAHHVRRDGEADPVRTAALREDGRIDPDQTAVHGDQRTPRIARVDGGIRLNEEVEVRDADLGARQRRDDAAGHGLPDAERVADRQHQVAYFQIVGIAEIQEREGLAAVVDAQDGEVGLLVGSHDRGLELPPIGENDGDLVGPLDHVMVGDDGPPGIDDDPRTERVLDPLALRPTAETETVAEESAEEGIVEQRRELPGADDLARIDVDHRRRRLLDQRGVGKVDLGGRARRHLFRRRGRQNQDTEDSGNQGLRPTGALLAKGHETCPVFPQDDIPAGV